MNKPGEVPVWDTSDHKWLLLPGYDQRVEPAYSTFSEAAFKVGLTKDEIREHLARNAVLQAKLDRLVPLAERIIKNPDGMVYYTGRDPAKPQDGSKNITKNFYPDDGPSQLIAELKGLDVPQDPVLSGLARSVVNNFENEEDFAKAWVRNKSGKSTNSYTCLSCPGRRELQQLGRALLRFDQVLRSDAKGGEMALYAHTGGKIPVQQWIVRQKKGFGIW